MVASTEQAIANARAKSRRGLFPTNTCLMQIRKLFGVDAKFPTAARAWAGAKHRHPCSSGADVPRGGIPFWTGGSSGAGHIALGLGDGLCETTDFVNRGGFGVAHIDDITRRWGLTFEGWTEDLNGVRVWSPPPPPPPERKAAPVTPYDKAYELGEEIAALGKHVQKKYTARRRYIDGVADLLKSAPKPASRKAKK